MPNFRLDRFLTLYFFHPLIRMKRSAYDRKIPILMYHSISDDKESSSHPYYHINTSPAVFAKQMRFLSDNNYTVIDLKDLKNCFDTNSKPTGNYAVITFDDGYRDFYTDAYPVLKEHSFTATVFLPTDFIGSEKNKLKGKEHLTWSQVSELSDGGISFGSHTITHPQLSILKYEEIEYEIKSSKKIIENKLGKDIYTFSYPFKFPETNSGVVKILRDLLKKHGYLCSVSTRIGTTSKMDDIYFMKRIPVNSKDDIPFFHAKLEGAYDWLYSLQKISKKIQQQMP